MTYILIIVLGAYSSQSGIATITQEFSTHERCEIARKHIIDSISRGDPRHYSIIRQSLQSHGCYQK